MIILEGPDGAGKTTLQKILCDELRLPAHERASTSLGGPVDNLFSWTVRDIRTWPEQQLAVYDRHPMISEFIYGPVVRNHMDPKFLRAGSAPVWRDFIGNSLIILCLPPWEHVQANAGLADQMPGVTDHLEGIYDAYWYLNLILGDRAFRYDYTRDGSKQEVKAMARMHMAKWRRRFVHV